MNSFQCSLRSGGKASRTPAHLRCRFSVQPRQRQVGCRVMDAPRASKRPSSAPSGITGFERARADLFSELRRRGMKTHWRRAEPGPLRPDPRVRIGDTSPPTAQRSMAKRIAPQRITRHSAPPPADTAISAAAPAAVRRQRMRGADLRDRLVPADRAGDRFVGRVARRAARHVHGRHVPRQPAAAAVRVAGAASAARLRDARGGHRRARADRARRRAARRRHRTRRRRCTASAAFCCARSCARSACFRRRC